MSPVLSITQAEIRGEMTCLAIYDLIRMNFWFANMNSTAAYTVPCASEWDWPMDGFPV